MTQVLRVAWLALPFTAGAAIADVVPTGDGPNLVATIAAWLLWAVVMVAVIILTPTALTVARALSAVAPTGTFVAVLAADEPPILGVVGLGLALLATGLIWSAPFADDSLGGTAYGDERRFSLRSPGVLVLGIIPAVVAVVTVGVLTAPTLWWQGSTVLGFVAAVVGWGVAAIGTRSIHQLSLRMLVFVPNGVTVVDPILLGEPVLFPAAGTRAFGPAPADTHAVDLTGRALGTPLQIVMTPTDGTASDDGGVMVSLKTNRTSANAVRVDTVLVAPARPGAVMDEARRRHFGVASAPPTTSSPT